MSRNTAPDLADVTGYERPHASPHAAQAARYLLDDLKSRALVAESIDEAISRGYLTDLQWCETLDIFREGLPERLPLAEQKREWYLQRRARLQAGPQ
ncbi:hypothetical protein GCM10022631_11980 [Deinococcus rubellus]|uniref:Uncharacterized protein n=1 Tax=Deinococcus rubellus TaxID=1889240 RepID=A0ABY5YCW0_9DEIO|nr:hypothetical protein [Deinococcus rubellus]UWX62756.1 hypothetical protein N0D28_08215 [Deinococcus rubellus]